MEDADPDVRLHTGYMKKMHKHVVKVIEALENCGYEKFLSLAHGDAKPNNKQSAMEMPEGVLRHSSTPHPPGKSHFTLLVTGSETSENPATYLGTSSPYPELPKKPTCCPHSRLLL